MVTPIVCMGRVRVVRLAGNFCRRDVRVVIANVVVVVVHRTFAVEVAVGAHQASLRGWNVVVVDVALVAFAFNGNDG